METVTVESDRPMSFGSSFASGIGSGLSSAIGSAASGIFSAHQADKSRDFARQQSKTQYQRAVKDLEAAGLNPILAAFTGGNASMPGALASPLAVHTSGALDFKHKLAEINRLRSQANLNDEQAGVAQITKDLVNENVNSARAFADMNKLDAELKRDMQSGRRDRADWYNSELGKFVDRAADIVGAFSPFVPKTSLNQRTNRQKIDISQ